MIRKSINCLIDKLLNESSASNLSSKKSLVIGNRSYEEIREGIDELHKSTFDSDYRSRKFEKSIRSYKEVLKK